MVIMTDSPRVDAQWAWAKVARAGQHIRELESRIGTWAATSGYGPAAAISEDRLSWEVRARLPQPPPLAEWSLIAGDAVHTLRSALDVLVWANSAGSSLEPKQREKIGFPLVQDEVDWRGEWGRKLRSVPDHVADRIRDCQPFNRPAEEVAGDGLLLLHDLDIRDKHRLALETAAVLAEFSFQHGVEFHDEDAAARNVPPNVTFHQAPLEDGALVAEGRTKDPIAKIRGSINLTFRVALGTEKGPVPVIELLGGLASHVGQVVTYVQSGPSAVTEEPV